MNVAEYAIGGGRVYVYATPEGEPKVYRPVGETDVPRSLVVHDGPALVDGHIVYVEYDGTLFDAYGDWIPKSSLPTWTPRDKLGEPAVLLERVYPENGGVCR